MASYKYILIALCLIGACQAAMKIKRSPKAIPQDAAQADPKDKDKDKDKEPSWKPVSEPQEFTIMVDDNINKADQFRHETWKPGNVIEGEYIAPGRDGKWLKVTYRGDKEGFHILNQQPLTDAEVDKTTGGGAADQQVKVETVKNGHDIKYTLNKDDIKYTYNKDDVKKGNANKKPEQKSGL